jgi:hypothetical protein
MKVIQFAYISCFLPKESPWPITNI